MSSSNFQDTAVMSFGEFYDSLKISNEEIESATDNFADVNLIAQGTFYEVYKGQLLHSGHLINIVARIYRESHIRLFFNEVMMCRILKHKNISSTFKIVNMSDKGRSIINKRESDKGLIILNNQESDNGLIIVNKRKSDKGRIIINKHEANESLDKHLSGSTLTWMQRLKICVGVARALSYIHDDLLDDQYMIHGNIKSSKILLDDNWEPKLHGFRYAQRVKRNHGYLTSKYNGSLHYMDPAYENTKTLTYKSDVFSFGVVLFEVLFGTMSSIQNGDNWYFARLARLHYEEGTLDDMINPDLRKQMDLQSLEIFSEIAYFCLKEQRGERPTMNQIVKKLETTLELQQKHQTPEHSRAVNADSLSNHMKGKNLDHLKIRRSDIELATNKFSPANYIGHGGYGMVYKGELAHYDGNILSATKRKNNDVHPKRLGTVAIKRLFSILDKQGDGGFSNEIEMLSKCKHPNVVSLLGFCEEGLEQILIYEYVINGSLNGYLGNVNNMTNFTWARRLQICLDIANGLHYLHTSTQDKPTIIHRDIKSDNILLDSNWVAKIADFGLSKLRSKNQMASTINTRNIAGTDLYLDPEYLKTGNLKKESDIYSFGVVLFEILCGRVAYDEMYYANNDSGLPSTIRRHFDERSLKKIVDPKLKEANENILMANGGLNQDSLDIFLNIAYKCLENVQALRPTTKVIIDELERALYFQKNSKNKLQISLIDIKSGTNNFCEDRCIGEGRYWKQYEGEIPLANDNGWTKVVAKRFDNKSFQGNHHFLRELYILLVHKHENIITLVGYCNEMDENIILYEHASNGSLTKYLNSGSLTWTRRLKISINVANGLDFIHKERITHRDIKTSSIVIDGDWKAKISNLELSMNFWENDKPEYVTNSLSYVDPLYEKHGYSTQASDIYSLGVVLIEILSGGLACVVEESTTDLVRKCKQKVRALDELVFKDIKEHLAPESLATFFELATACLELSNNNRPRTKEVLRLLTKALELQDDYEIWEPKLPTDYKEIILMSNTPEIYANESKKDLYDMLTKGILLQQGKLWFVLGVNGERNAMISSTKFSYKKQWCIHKWKSIPESRFQKVAQMSDISNLKIQIKIKTQLLSPGINYAVLLVFKFHRPIKSTTNWMYVNLKYKMGSDNLHAYFARRREDGWMTTELFQFLNHKTDMDFEVLIESFSQCYCGRRLNCVYVEGIEFKATYNVKYEEIEKLKDVEEVLKSSSNLDEVQPPPINLLEILKRFGNDEGSIKVIHSLLSDDEQLCLLNRVNGKKHLMLSAIGCFYDSSKMKPFHLKFSPESRIQVVIELLRQQVFGIKCKIRSQLLSPDTDYVCYLVFKLSEKCRGLHCPVRVRNVLKWKNKEIGLVCFRPLSQWNYVNDSIWVPKQREDGWMEVIVWKFNSTSEIRNNHIPMHLKLITYEGTMSGLIASALEIRSI